MIEWAIPQLLWFLVLVPAAGVFVWMRLRRAARARAVFAEAGLVQRLAPDIDPRRRAAREVLRLGALALMIVALAGPKWGSRWEEVRREGVDLIVALDTSRSMLATDVKPNRLDRAKLAVLDLLKQLQGDRIGLVAFAGTAFLECPLTLDYTAFAQSLNAMHVGIIPRGGTALAEALRVSIEAFEARQGKHEAVILITDGEDHDGKVEDAAKEAAERGIRVYTVGIGTAGGELIPAGGGQSFVKDDKGQVVKSRLNEQALQAIAMTSGGAYVHGAGASLGLEEIFDDHIAKMEKRELASTLERRFEARFQWPLGLAVVLLLVEPLIGDTRRRAAAVCLAAGGLWLWSPHPARAASLAEGNRLYDEGKYADAAQQYGEVLVDEPDSGVVRFNLAAAQHKDGKYADAAASLQKIPPSDDAAWNARVAYNAGNAQYRLGAGAADKDPKAAIAAYEQALLAYKRAMGADPSNADAKFNHEVVEQKLAALKKKLEEQQQQQQEQQQEQEQQGQQQQPEQQEQGQQEEQQAAGGEEPEPEKQPEQEPAEQDRQEPGAGEAQAGGEEERQEQMDRQQAHGVIDTARDEEVKLEELQRRSGAAVVGEPRYDW